ncbi:MAG: radical SAM protein [Candidatus Aenigmarchaeota archaeon]|nr:radical SAM protein [Candidatus Aenigmarchaeota archaeon]
MRKALLGFAGIMKVLTGRLKLPVSLSVDVTYRCNLSCKHCYFLKDGYREELPVEAFLNKIKKLKKKYNLYSCSWVGGEPLLRKDLIEKGKKLFPFNWIITNGTIQLPEWKDCVFFVSVDGTKKYHETIRGKGTYNKIKDNITSSSNRIFIATVLNKINYKSIDEMIQEWSKTNVKGINFDFYTPIYSNDQLFIPLKKRDKILDHILDLKKEYGNFILLSKKIIELMKSYNYKNVVGENCLQRKVTVSLDPMGRIKKPCVMGNVDCSKCGCIITYAINAALNKDLETMWLLFSRLR